MQSPDGMKISIGERNINDLRYREDTALLACMIKNEKKFASSRHRWKKGRFISDCLENQSYAY